MYSTTREALENNQIVEAQTKMRLPREIQAAHDRIVAILIGEVPNPFGEEETALLSASAVVLC